MLFNILIISKNRPTLIELLDKLSKQLRKTDLVTIVFDGVSFNKSLVTKYPNYTFIQEVKHDNYGFGLRNKYNKLEGDYIFQMDDDDYYTDGWRQTVEDIIRVNNYPKIINFNSYLEVIHQNSFRNITGYAPYTGNIVLKNIPELIEEPWGTHFADETIRYNKLMKKYGYIISDYVLIYKRNSKDHSVPDNGILIDNKQLINTLNNIIKCPKQ